MYYDFNRHAIDGIPVTIEAIVCREYSILIRIIQLKYINNITNNKIVDKRV